MGATAINDLADVEAILQQMRERADTKPDSTNRLSVGEDAPFGPYASAVEVLGEPCAVAYSTCPWSAIRSSTLAPGPAGGD